MLSYQYYIYLLDYSMKRSAFLFQSKIVKLFFTVRLGLRIKVSGPREHLDPQLLHVLYREVSITKDRSR